MLLLIGPVTLFIASVLDMSSSDGSASETVVEKEFIPTLEKAYEDLSRQEKMGGLQSGFEEALSLYFMYLDSKVPWEKKAPTIQALLYFIDPIDDTPDMGPGGWVDDFQKIHEAYEIASSAITDEHRHKAASVFASMTKSDPGHRMYLSMDPTPVSFFGDIQIEPTIERKLWRLEGPAPRFLDGKPYEGDYKFIVTSVVAAGSGAIIDQPNGEKEGFVFPADEKGNNLAWATVSGSSVRGGSSLTAEEVLADSGFEVAHQVMPSNSKDRQVVFRFVDTSDRRLKRVIDDLGNSFPLKEMKDRHLAFLIWPQARLKDPELAPKPWEMDSEHWLNGMLLQAIPVGEAWAEISPGGFKVKVKEYELTLTVPPFPQDRMGGVLSAIGQGIGKGVVGVVRGVGSVAVGVGAGIGKGVAGAAKDAVTTSPQEEKRKLKHKEKAATKKQKGKEKKEVLSEKHDVFEQGLEQRQEDLEERKEGWDEEMAAAEQERAAADQAEVAEVLSGEGYGGEGSPAYQEALAAKHALSEELKNDPDFNGIIVGTKDGQFTLIVYGDFSEHERYIPQSYDGVPVILDRSRRKHDDDEFFGEDQSHDDLPLENLTEDDFETLLSFTAGMIERAYPWRVEGLPQGWTVKVRAKSAAIMSHPPGTSVLHPGLWQIELTIPGKPAMLLGVPLHVTSWPSVEGAPNEFVLWYDNGTFIWGIDTHEGTPEALGVESDGSVSDNLALAHRVSARKAPVNRIPIAP